MADIEVTLTDNSEAIKNATQEALEAGFMSIGMEAETFAKQELTHSGAVDTGRLRNSVTFALSGGKANIQSYTADFARRKTKRGKIVIYRKNLKHYKYTWTAPKEKNGVALYLGTNVEYGSYIETGTTKMPTARPYIRPALADHTDRWEEILEDACSAIDSAV